MIRQKCFTLEYLREQGGQLQVADLRNLEKCVLALELTSRLKNEGLDFVFKGGTSLLLHCDPAKRLSIDVDILSLEPLEKFQEALAKATKAAPFQNWKHQDHKDHEAPPTKHFKAFYTSAVNSEQDSILLDVICTESPYAEVIETPIKVSFLEIEEETRVRIPSASCLLADKVAAFAPTTIGYLYHPIDRRTGEPKDPRPIKVVKHLYDIGLLASLANDAAAAISTYKAIHAEQIIFRGLDCSIEETLMDTQRAAYHVCRIGGQKQNLANQEALEHRGILEKGISSLANHLFSQPFRPADYQIAAAKAALAAQVILSNATDFNIAAFLSEELDNKLEHAELKKPWEHISRPLKKGNPEAFRIWYQADLMRTQLQDNL